MISQFQALLEVVYHGPAPPSQVEALLAQFDTNHDGRVSLDEFVAGVREIKRACGGWCAVSAPRYVHCCPWPCSPAGRIEAGEKPTVSAASRVSGQELRESRRRHVRDAAGPADVLAVPLTTSQEAGWHKEAALPPQKGFSRVKCDETKYAEELLKSGVFY